MAKRMFCVRIDAALAERFLNAVWHQRTSMTAVIEDEFARIVANLEKANGKKPYPQREGDLPTQRKRRA